MRPCSAVKGRQQATQGFATVAEASPSPQLAPMLMQIVHEQGRLVNLVESQGVALSCARAMQQPRACGCSYRVPLTTRVVHFREFLWRLCHAWFVLSWAYSHQGCIASLMHR